MKLETCKKFENIFMVISMLTLAICLVGGVIALVIHLIFKVDLVSGMAGIYLFGIFWVFLIIGSVFRGLAERKFKKMGVCPHCKGSKKENYRNASGEDSVVSCSACSGAGKYLPEVYAKWEEIRRRESEREIMVGPY